MKNNPFSRLADYIKLVRISARLVAGRRFWIAPLLPLLWSAFQAIRLLVGWQEERFEAEHAQNVLIGLPLVVLAIGFGVRVIAGEMDRRTLEIAYTVPGGSHRVWLAKVVACVILLIFSEVLLAITTNVLFTAYPFWSLYGALQAALFYLVLAIAFSSLFRSMITGALGTVAVLVFNGLISGFGDNQIRISPFFNIFALRENDMIHQIPWALQNHIGFALVIVGIAALAFARAEQREKLLG
jgi:hypothetical protein